MSKDTKNPVGYRRPPVERRFKKGQSGNPKGRPKGQANFSTDVKKVLAMPVPIERDGKSKIISTQEAGLVRLREMALKGDFRALDQLLKHASQHNAAPPPETTDDDLAAEDQAILDAWVLRIRGDKP